MPPSGRSVLIVIHLQETSRFRLPNLAPCAKLERLWYSEYLHDPGKRSDRGNFIQGTLRRESIGVVADGHQARIQFQCRSGGASSSRARTCARGTVGLSRE